MTINFEKQGNTEATQEFAPEHFQAGDSVEIGKWHFTVKFVDTHDSKDPFVYLQRINTEGLTEEELQNSSWEKGVAESEIKRAQEIYKEGANIPPHVVKIQMEKESASKVNYEAEKNLNDAKINVEGKKRVDELRAAEIRGELQGL